MEGGASSVLSMPITPGDVKVSAFCHGKLSFTLIPVPQSNGYISFFI